MRRQSKLTTATLSAIAMTGSAAFAETPTFKYTTDIPPQISPGRYRREMFGQERAA